MFLQRRPGAVRASAVGSTQAATAASGLARLLFPHALMSHRGGSLERVENTLPAFRRSARELRVDLLEMDVRLTRDGRVVVCHDDDLGRLCGVPGKTVADFAYADLPPLKIPDALRDDPSVVGDPESVRIPLLEEVLVEFPNSDPTDNYYGRKMERAPYDELEPTAPEIWTRRQVGNPAPKFPKDDPDALLQDPLYTPPPKEDVGIGPMLYPLHMPEYDQTRPDAANRPELSKFYTYKHLEFFHVDDPIGDYPRLPTQWAVLKDPYKYWDQQGRRNYGEIMHDHANLLGTASFLGPAAPSGLYAKVYLKFFLAVFTVYGLVTWWDPYKNRLYEERDFPFDGLRVELGSDPANSEDTVLSANVYKGPGSE
ncbi:Lysophospholipase D gdpd1 [Cladochytrium tenue]|nr:Lysophospholipase D gdpd1 [Cladochytrium tenue]